MNEKVISEIKTKKRTFLLKVWQSFIYCLAAYTSHHSTVKMMDHSQRGSPNCSCNWNWFVKWMTAKVQMRVQIIVYEIRHSVLFFIQRISMLSSDQTYHFHIHWECKKDKEAPMATRVFLECLSSTLCLRTTWQKAAEIERGFKRYDQKGID